MSRPSVEQVSCAQPSITAGHRTVCRIQLDRPAESESAQVFITSSSANLKAPSAVAARAGVDHLAFEISADAAASFETANLEVRIGSEAAHASIAIEPAGIPELRVPAELAGTPGVPIHFTVTAAGGADMSIRLAATGLPRGAVFDTDTGIFDWTPAKADLGAYGVSFTASNSSGAVASKAVSLLVGSGVPVVSTLAGCSPGAVAEVRGNWLFNGAIPMADPSGSGDELGGTRVSVNGEYAPVLYASADRVGILCPAVAAGTSLSVAVETAAGRSNPVAASMQANTPRLLTVADSESVQALAVRSGTSELAAIPNDKLNGKPALAGDTLTFQATGLPCSMDSVYSADMQIGLDVMPVTLLAPEPGHAGVCRVEVVVPPSAVGDAVPVSLSVRGGDGARITSNRALISVDVR
ncbi:MAG TPA: putative Ig domain-containing protein [Bryobacteraceae bacterium]|nr:putative Ig domain-containing protein [Bryobacteraceae bacterium]